MEASQARSQSLDAELRTASDTLGEERAALALALEGLRRDLEASDGALSSARQQLRDTEAELAERRVGEQRASDEAGALQRQLGAVQERLAECEAELDASRREVRPSRACPADEQQRSLRHVVARAPPRMHAVLPLLRMCAQGATSSAELVAQLARRDEAVAQLKVAMQEAEVQASVAHKEQQERLSHLQRELINAQEHLVEREFELGSQIKQLSAQLDAASKEAMVQARLLDGKGAELVAARASLAAHQEALTNVKVRRRTWRCGRTCTSPVRGQLTPTCAANAARPASPAEHPDGARAGAVGAQAPRRRGARGDGGHAGQGQAGHRGALTGACVSAQLGCVRLGVTRHAALRRLPDLQFPSPLRVLWRRSCWPCARGAATWSSRSRRTS